MGKWKRMSTSQGRLHAVLQPLVLSRLQAPSWESCQQMVQDAHHEQSCPEQVCRKQTAHKEQEQHISHLWQRRKSSLLAAEATDLKGKNRMETLKWRWEASQGGNKHPVWEAGAEGPWVSLLVCIGFVSRNDFLFQVHIGADSGETSLRTRIWPDSWPWDLGFRLSFLKRTERPGDQALTRPGSWPGENPACLFFIQNQTDPDWLCVDSNEIQNGTNQEGAVKPQEGKEKSLSTPKSVVYGAAALWHPTQPIHPPTTSKCESKC